MTRIDIMVDIETLGTEVDSTIIQVAGIAFDIETGEEVTVYNHIADISRNKENNITGETLKWWLDTDTDLFKTLLSQGTTSSEDLLKSFHVWLEGLVEDYGRNNVYLWGNGILFDNKMIEHQLNRIGLDYPIYYKNDRDMRTIVDIAGRQLGISESELKEQFEDESLRAHDALDDVRYQINLVSTLYNYLTKDTPKMAPKESAKEEDAPVGNKALSREELIYKTQKLPSIQFNIDGVKSTYVLKDSAVKLVQSLEKNGNLKIDLEEEFNEDRLIHQKNDIIANFLDKSKKDE